MHPSKRSQLKAALGPGLIMAGAAIGVSHLVQSTRAGATFGTSLMLLIVVACLFKYPFLEFGPRYAAATGESMLVGFRRLGRWAVWTFAFITLSTMLVILASISLVTAGLAGVVLGLSANATVLSVGVLLACLAVLAIGQYRGLELAMKLMMGALVVSTLAATSLALFEPANWAMLDPSLHWDSIWTASGVAFVLALLGWMPIPLDVSVWHSIWTLERSAKIGQLPSVQAAVWDFQLGYITATLSALVFVLLGATILGSSNAPLPTAAVAFASTLVSAYTQSLGDWSHALIGIAALSAMFSTTLAVADAYPRVLYGLWQVSQNTTTPVTQEEGSQAERPAMTTTVYLGVLVFNAIGAFVIIAFFGAQFTRLIDFATTVSFLSAPILGWLSLRLIGSSWVPKAHQPSRGLRALAVAGLVFLMAFCVLWTYWRFA